MPISTPIIHSELSINASGNRRSIVTLPNIKIASLKLSNNDKPMHTTILNIGHGSMTASEPKRALRGKETGASFNGSS